MALFVLQAGVDLAFFTIVCVMWVRLRKPPQDDPRLSRGLQLLQSKITILEDLSDRTETQCKQLTQLLEQKTRIVQDKIVAAEQHVARIEQVMQKSLEVADIFQDRIPHQEVLERKRTIEYVKAARLSNRGLHLDEILRQVDLPREQVELIVKFNRDQLMFDETALPAWAKHAGLQAETGESGFSSLGKMHFLGSLESPARDPQPMQKIERQFKESVRQYDSTHKSAPAAPVEESKASALMGAAQSITKSLTNGAANLLNIQESPQESAGIRRVEFPRVHMPGR